MRDQPCHLSSLPVGLGRDGDAGLGWSWLTKSSPLCRKPPDQTQWVALLPYPIFQPAKPLLPMQSSSLQLGCFEAPGHLALCCTLIILLWRHMEQTALDNHVHAKVFIISMWFVWQIRCQEKYVHLIALTKLHSCYNLAPKSPLLLCFLEKKIKTYDSSNKNYDAACSLDSCSKNTKSLLIIILYSYIAGRKMKGKVKEAKEVPWGKLENSCFSQTTSEEPDSVMYINESSSSISC